MKELVRGILCNLLNPQEREYLHQFPQGVLSMDKQVKALAEQLGITTEQLFVRAYNGYGGRNFGLHSAIEMHRRWTNGTCVPPPYVQSMVRHYATKHLDDQLQLPFN
jgi:Ni/Co efflux regulator RcnB